MATVLNNLGSTQRLLGELEEAQSHLERALSIDELTYGNEDPRVVADLYNLGLVLFDTGDKTQAYVHIERAFKSLLSTLVRIIQIQFI